MADRRDLISLLERSGSVRLPLTGSGHPKWRLPNGKMFVHASTPSDRYGYNNAIALLRRELRSTHPQLAEEHLNLPKNKRWDGHNPLADLIALKGPIPPSIAIPGSQQMPPPEAEFQILEAEPEPAPAPEAQPEPHRSVMPRKWKTLPPPPGPARTLSPEQLQEANRILQAEGQAAMDAYLNSHREELIAVDKKIISERYAEPVRVEPNPNRAVYSEDKQMADVLERARQELQATSARITKLEDQILSLQGNLETEIERKGKLEAYIVKHEELVSEATTMLTDLLPPPPPENVRAMPSNGNGHKGHKVEHGKSRFPRVMYTMADVRAKAFPILRSRGLADFNTDDVLDAIRQCGFPGPVIARMQLQQWLYNDFTRAHPILTKAAPGRFRFIEESDASAGKPVQPSSQHHFEEAHVG